MGNKKDKELDTTDVFLSQIDQFNRKNYELLVGLVGELVIHGAATKTLAQQQGDDTLFESTNMLARLVEEVRDRVLRLRTVPADILFTRYRTAIDQWAAQIACDIEVLSNTSETLVDNDIVEKIDSALCSLIIALLDNYVELSDTSHQIALRLEASQASGNVLFKVILQFDTRQNSENFLSQCKQHAAFSEMETIVCDLLGDMCLLDHGKNEFELDIRIPLSQAIFDGFLVRSGTEFYVIPLDDVEECMESTLNSGDKLMHEYINLREAVLPLLRLKKAFNVESPSTTKENIVVIKHESGRVGLIVDELHGEIQAVNKPLGAMFSEMKGISGSTILGNGEVAVILDVGALTAMVRVNSDLARSA